MKIHDRRLEELERITAQCMQAVRTNDTGMLQYELDSTQISKHALEPPRSAPRRPPSWSKRSKRRRYGSSVPTHLLDLMRG